MNVFRNRCVVLLVAGILGLPAAGAWAAISVETDKPQYTTGDSVVVTVRNELTEPVYYLGMCSLSDCLQVNGDWECEDSLCDAPQQVLLAGEEMTFRIRVIGLIVGDMKYRFEYKTAIRERVQQAYSNSFFIISTGEPEQITVGEQVRKFPAADGAATPRVYRPNSSGKGRRDNTYVARNLRNQDVPSNQEIIRQRKQQDRGSRQASGYGLAEKEVILSVSGMSSKMRQSLVKILLGEYPFVRSMEEIDFSKGVAQYFLSLDINVDEFADRLEATQFPSFRLDLIRVSPNHIDCRLRFE
ncbi:MAG: hypothetical protein KC897_02310 [Candidatus Omnitrophica bacterium]|nr:hypothetical protein [Candidatus Omnitrophota bacterium]MCB9721063.1 hypothetical protein [Candidatus Omnitrophota bacterium]